MPETNAILDVIERFHEDWTEDFSSWEELIDDFVVHDRDRAAKAPNAIRDLLARKTEQELETLCDEVTPWDFARMADGTYAGWFRMLLQRIEAQLAFHES